MTKSRLIGCAASAILALGVGCGSKETSSVPAPKEAPAASREAGNAASQAGESAKKAIDQVQGDASKVASQAGETAAAAKQSLAAGSDEMLAKASAIIESAKKLTGENKWAEALKALEQLANYKLTPEQQTLVDGLKKQINAALQQAATQKAAGEAGKALNNLLKK
jgi:hypothetical protein